MSKQYQQLNQEERDQIYLLLRQGNSQKEIAVALKRDKSTISRELNQNKHKKFNEMVAKLFLLQFYLFGCVIVRLRKMLFAVAGLRPQNILLVFLASLENLKFRYEIVLQPSL